MSAVTTNALNKGILTDATATGATLDAVFVGLFTATNGELSHNTTIADVTEVLAADLTSYARQAVTWATPGLDEDGGYQVVGSRVKFQATVIVNPTTVIGYAVYSAVTTGTLLYAELLDTPFGFVSVDDQLFVVPVVKYDGSNIGSGEVID